MCTLQIETNVLPSIQNKLNKNTIFILYLLRCRTLKYGAWCKVTSLSWYHILWFSLSAACSVCRCLWAAHVAAHTCIQTHNHGTTVHCQCHNTDNMTRFLSWEGIIMIYNRRYNTAQPCTGYSHIHNPSPRPHYENIVVMQTRNMLVVWRRNFNVPQSIKMGKYVTSNIIKKFCKIILFSFAKGLISCFFI